MVDALAAAGFAAAGAGVWNYSDALELLFHALYMPTKPEVDALRAAGVSDATLCAETTFVKGCDVTWHPRRSFAADGPSRAFVVAVRDAFGEVVDLCAWPPDRPDRWARHEGAGFALGEEALGNAGTFAFGGSLRVVRTPLGWLQAEGRALCILDPGLAWHRLSNAPRLAAEDVEHGTELDALIQPPARSVRILVPGASRRRRAA